MYNVLHNLTNTFFMEIDFSYNICELFVKCLKIKCHQIIITIILVYLLIIVETHVLL